MLRLCLLDYRFSHDIRITFANTGQEHEETLRFVDAVDRNFCKPMGYSVTWIEAVIRGYREGPQARVVTYDTASRGGEPFEAAIAKHGIFNKAYPNCTGRTKTEPMQWFLKSQGWKFGTYDTAIGIRHDERFLRERASAKENRIIYPLIEREWNKRMVNLYMEQYEWDLNLPSDAYGNCKWCWKKSQRKLMTVAKTNPEYFDFPARMEAKYGHITKGKKQDLDRVFFRENRSAQDILKAAQTENFEPYEDDKFDQREFFDDFLDAGTSCGETCEIYGE